MMNQTQLLHALRASAVTAAPKGNNSYDWFTHNGPEMAVEGKGRSTVFRKGTLYGVRPSGNGKFIRLITGIDGPTKVYTIDPETAQKLAKHCKAV